MIVSAVTFPDKIIGTDYDKYNNNEYFVTPNNINQLKYAINFNADKLSSVSFNRGLFFK